MTPSSGLLAAALLVLAVPLKAEPHRHHGDHPRAAPEAILAAEGKRTQAVDSGEVQPSVPCGRSGRRMCYSPEELRLLAAQLSNGRDKTAEFLRQTLTAVHAGAEVSRRDLRQLMQYLDAEEKAADTFAEVAGKEAWDAITRNPRRAKHMAQRIMASLPEEKRQRILEHHAVLQSLMNELFENQEKNPLHETLHSSDDFIADLMMPPAGGKPVMDNERWQNADPGNTAPWLRGAKEALENGNPQGALGQIDRALKLDPNNSLALSLASAAYYDLKDFNSAAQFASRALALDPNDARALAVSKLAHDLGARAPDLTSRRDETALPSELARAGSPWISRDPGAEARARADAAARQAENALNLKDAASARRLASQALESDPRFAYAYGLRAFAELRDKNESKALSDSLAGLAVDSKEKLSQKARAEALIRMGRYREGLAAALAAAESDPTSGRVRYLEAAARFKLGDRQGALAALKTAAELDPRYDKFYQAALQLAPDEDMSLLFGDLLPDGAVMRAGQAPAQSGKNRFLLVLAAALSGGLLLSYGFVRFTPVGRRVKTIFTRRGEARDERPEPAPFSATPAAEAPMLRGQFRTVRQLGAGGMGVVWEAMDLSLNRRVAVKKMLQDLRRDRKQRERFVTEARLVAGLRHPNIVEIYSIVDEGDDLALVFEFVEGRTLHETIGHGGPMPVAAAMTVFRGVAAALEYAHERGVIHRDLKPSNVMVAPDGAVKVMDFGIARTAKDAITRASQTNTVIGTPPYMAPEQEQGMVRRESDVYSLAVCLYEMLTGELPFAGSSGGMLMNKINKAYTPVSNRVDGLPAGFDAVFDRAFEPDPEKRFRSVAELRAAFEGVAAAV